MKSLNAIIYEYLDGKIEMDVICEYIDGMPVTRKTTDELLGEINNFDLYELYEKLIVDCRNFLTKEQTDEIKARYKEIFDIPMPE